MSVTESILDRAIRERREAIEERDRLRAALEAQIRKLEMFAGARQRGADANRPGNDEAVAAACRGWAGALREALDSGPAKP